MVEGGVHGELAFQNLAIDHGDQCGAKVITHLDKLATLQLLVILNRLSLLALQVLVLGVESCVKSGLEGVRIYYSKLLEHHESRRGFFVPFVCEFAVIEREEAILLRQKIWQHFDQVVIFVLINLTLA